MSFIKQGVKRIQYVTITLGVGVTTLPSGALTAFDTTKIVIQPAGRRGSFGSVSDYMGEWSWDSTTVVRVTRDTSAISCRFSAFVQEYF